MIITIIIIIIQLYWYINYYWKNTYKENDPNTWIDYFDIKKGFTNQLYFFRTFANIFFAYNYHAGILPITSTLKKNNIKTKSKIINLSIIWYTSMYLLIGIIGFFTYPINTPDLIVQREKIFSSDLLINIGKAFIIFALILKIPVNFKPLKIHLYTILYNNKKVSYENLNENEKENLNENEKENLIENLNKNLIESENDDNNNKFCIENISKFEVSNTLDNIFTILISYLAALLAVLFTNISNYFDIIGGICSINISVVIPCKIFYTIIYYYFLIFIKYI